MNPTLGLAIWQVAEKLSGTLKGGGAFSSAAERAQRHQRLREREVGGA